jgi:A/G-specific adenine glycosylase
MLQQTQVLRVIPFYQKFLKRFPDVRALASAQERTVRAHWAGLGYYRRARNLHSAAKMVVREFAGRIPEREQDLRRLPGVGRYTAGAIRSIGFNRPAPIVDGNIRRIIHRLFAAEANMPEKDLWQIASHWTPEYHPSRFNQALMDLGALVCTAVQPACDLCPLSGYCRAWERGLQDRIPEARRVRATESVALAVLLVRRRGRLLLVPNPIPFIPGEWAMPVKEIPRGHTPRRAARDLWRRHLCGSAILRLHGSFRHAITHRRILVHLFIAETHTPGMSRRAAEKCQWTHPSAVTDRLTSSLFRKAWAQNLAHRKGST